MSLSLAGRLEKAERIVAEQSARTAANRANLQECIDQLIKAARSCDSPIDDLTREEAALYFIAIDAQNDADPCQALINRAREDYGVTLRSDEAALYFLPEC